MRGTWGQAGKLHTELPAYSRKDRCFVSPHFALVFTWQWWRKVRYFIPYNVKVKCLEEYDKVNSKKMLNCRKYLVKRLAVRRSFGFGNGASGCLYVLLPWLLWLSKRLGVLRFIGESGKWTSFQEIQPVTDSFHLRNLSRGVKTHAKYNLGNILYLISSIFRD